MLARYIISSRHFRGENMKPLKEFEKKYLTDYLEDILNIKVDEVTSLKDDEIFA